MPETQETKSNQNKPRDKKEGRSRAWLWFVVYGLLVLVGLSIGSWYFEKGADRAKFWVEGLLSAGVLSVVIFQAAIYRKQWDTMERSLAVQSRAYVEVHSIETNPSDTWTVIKVENIGKIPAKNVRVMWTLYGLKNGEIYKPAETKTFDYERLSPGNFRIEFDFALVSHFSPADVLAIFDKSMKVATFLQFQITYNDGFQEQTTRGLYGYIPKPKDKWLPVAEVKTLPTKIEASVEKAQA